MPALLERLFKIRVHRNQKPNDRSVTFVMDNRALKEYLTANGLQRSHNQEVSVPRLVRQSPPKIVGAYLRGLFEADGSVEDGYPALTTNSSRLAREVAALLIGLGAPAKIRTLSAALGRSGESETYQVRITSSAGLQAWRTQIGSDPRSRFVSVNSRESDLSREGSYVLPNSKFWLQPVLDRITLEQVDKEGRGRKINFRTTEPTLRRQVFRYLRDERALTLSGYSRLKSEHAEAFCAVPAIDGLWFVKVAKVAPAGRSLTLDLEVSDNHTYLASGMVTHNTRRGANMGVLRVDHPDVEDFITCKTDENQITNFNISVGITDAFMRAVRDDQQWELRFPDVHDPRYREVGGTLDQMEAAGVNIQTHKKVRARELFYKSVNQAHHNGDAVVLFLDAANRSNPL